MTIKTIVSIEQNSGWQRFLQWFSIARVLGLVSTTVGLTGLVDGPIPNIPVREIIEFHQAISAELVGIGITILLIDTANEVRINQQVKANLISQMASVNSATALDAVRNLRMKGWLCDGSLKNAYLPQANLHKAQLGNLGFSFVSYPPSEKGYDVGRTLAIPWQHSESANLERAYLGQADLSEADLHGVNLKGCYLVGANLCHSNLERALLDHHTTLPNGDAWTESVDLEQFTNPEHPQYAQFDELGQRVVTTGTDDQSGRQFQNGF